MLLVEVERWDGRARWNFTYEADGAIDNWLSHADEVLRDVPWKDDCDGLASTVIDLCCRAGLKEENAFRLAVFASSDGSGHMVGCVITDDGRIWIVGDTFVNEPYLAQNMRHKPHIYRRLSESVWREGALWKLV
jgi:predicted transglutaminase-like cysteine proteinase